jgi:hypothetical protein
MNVDEFIRRGLAAQRAVDQVLTREQQRQELERDDSWRVHCSGCGQSVSSPLPVPVIVRAVVYCPDCVAKGSSGR